MKLIDGDNLIEHAEVNCESSDFVEKLIDYVSEQEEVSISCSHEKDLISRQAAIDAIEEIDWYHQNNNKDMVHGANSSEDQAWYKADDIYKTLEALPSAQPEIIRCSECKYYTTVTAQCEIRGKGLYLIRGLDDFCSRAERRTNG